MAEYKIFQVVNQDDKSVLQQVFRKYLSEPERCESINSNSKCSKLDVFSTPGKDNRTFFGWLTDVGLYYGQVREKKN